MSCHMCGNNIGFVFNTCVQCGYNNYSKQFETIKVDVVDLIDFGVDEEIIDTLIRIHSRKYKVYKSFKKENYNDTM